ncbi:MAG TPA: hypothetical protein VMZ22_01630 [Acidimicrobiales bacterium]|nr:hypothetical protein [Acidimicrobiales bacterium]
MPEFDPLVDEWIAHELEESPVRATQLGIDGYDELLGDHSATGYARRDAADDTWLARLDSVDESTLTFDQRIDLGRSTDRRSGLAPPSGGRRASRGHFRHHFVARNRWP